MKKKILKYTLITGGIGAVVGGSIVLYLFFMPHRDIQSTAVDYELSANVLVEEYLNNEVQSNDKYLQEEGDSKILSVKGRVSEISKNLQENIVILLKDDSMPAGVRCTFMLDTNPNASKIEVGQEVVIKGVIRSGAAYDKDLELYEDVILEKCDVI